ncbi:MAG: hypothetical protein NTW86_10875 [Candidatus Sumerlaeota bacterium]|nr:hypothetical protein [Candidatus Sumerlaeota bacterium]
MNRLSVRRAVCVWIVMAVGRAAFGLTAPTPVQISPPPADGSKPVAHDFPDVVVTSAGARAIAVWSGYDFYTTDAEELYTAVLSLTTWQTAVATGIVGDLFCPRVGNAGGGDEWILWAQQVSGNWDIYARHFASGLPIRLTTDAGSDTNLATASDPAHAKIFAVWQGVRNGRWAILLKEYSGGAWGAEKIVSQQSSSNEWFPKAAVDSNGVVWIAWDSYRNGTNNSYDIYLRSYSPASGLFGNEIQVTNSLGYDANVSIACDSSNRVWMAWETAPENWGKDNGRLVNESRLTAPAGHAFVYQRAIAVGVYDGTLKTTSVLFDTLYPTGFLGNTFDPIVTVDQWDRPWFFYARKLTYGSGANTGFAGWRLYMTRYNLNAWDAPVNVGNSTAQSSTQNSMARIERKMAVVRYSATQLLGIYHVDGRWKGTGSVANDMRHGPPEGCNIYAALITVPNETVGAPSLADPAPPGSPNPTHPHEAADIAAVRDYRATINGHTYQIIRGDFHRHTDGSWDGTGDSSVEDCFRYAYDAAQLDSVMPSDHHTQLEAKNGANPIYTNPAWNYYPWRRTQKYDDIYFTPQVVIPMYGYERSQTYPHGHRNVVFPQRSSGATWIVSTTSSPMPELPIDENNLWTAVLPAGGTTIPHTSGNDMGTSWQYDINPSVEHVLEIYQGCRYSYENYLENKMWPNMDQRSSDTITNNEKIHPDGYLHSLMTQRVAPDNDFRTKLGMICSSDHGSTHLSYANLYVESATRQGIMDAIANRRTYASMDNIVMDVRCGTHMQGEGFYVSEPPTLNIFVQAAKPLNEVCVVRDNQIIYSVDPSGQTNPTQFAADYTDSAVSLGYHYYYVRARQNDGVVRGTPPDTVQDGTMAWSSPMFVRYDTSRVGDWRWF